MTTEMQLAEELYDKIHSDEYAELGSGPVSVEPYISEEYFEKEREKIFQDAWMMVCHESELPEPGSYIVKDIEILKASIIVVRGKDGVIRAFHNVCTHRGNQLFYKPCAGKAKSFSCCFHGWTFNTDGSLRGVTEKDRFPDLDKDKLGLKKVGVDSWKGFVFIHPKAEPEQSLHDYLGTLADAIEDYPFEDTALAAVWTCNVKVNWKAFVDAFQESYHVAVVHRNVAPSLFAGVKSPFCRITSFRIHGNHRSASAPKNPNFKPSPTEAIAFGFSSTLSQKADAVHGEAWPGMNPDNIPFFGFDVNVIFPINFIDTAQGWYFTYEFWPVSVNETRYVAKLYVEKPKSWSQRIGQELSIVQLREALLEDLNTLEATQRGMESGAIDSIVLSDQELAIRHQHHIVDSIVRG